MTLQEVGRICDALRKEGRLSSEAIRSKVEDGTATDEDRREYSRWLHHDLGILDAEHSIMKAMYQEENAK